MQTNPEGIGTETPRFSWKIQSADNDVVQTAYQIEVASSEKDLKAGANLVWNTSKVASGKSVLVAYSGKPLASGKEYFWRVTVWTNNGATATSPVQRWSMALLKDADWDGAKWIGLKDDSRYSTENNRTKLPARYLRKEFKISAKPTRAMLYVSGVGSSVCYLNGKQTGDDVFGPLPTLYDVSVPYLSYNVTSLVKKGDNALGVALGNGRFLTMRPRGMLDFGFPRLIARLVIEYPDGKQETITTDASWKATQNGPITANSEFDGETYDANLALGKWTESGYDDNAWQKADLMDAPKGKLTAQLSPSLKVMKEIKPLSVTKTNDGRYIVDMGQNMVGWLKVRLSGKKGSEVKLRFAEVLQDDDKSQLYVANLRGAQVTDLYTPAADGQFTYEQTFTYHGFRFAEITGVTAAPSVDDFTGKVIYDKMDDLGSFECSEPLINKLFKNAYWGIIGNYRGMPTDCPQRDERLGWLGDRATGAFGESFLLNNVLLYRKWLTDIEESMNEAGSISVVSPRYWTIFNDDVTWPSAYFYIADMLYTQYGDLEPILKHYKSMKKWCAHIAEVTMKDYIMTKDTYGDWCMPPESPELIHSNDPSRKTGAEVLSTTVYYSILGLMQKFARLNGADADVAEYATLAEQIREAYNKKYFNYETAQYDNNTVTANILSLRLGLVPAGYEQKVFANIVEKTLTDCKGHVSAGVLGIQHLMRGLTEYGNLELAYRIVTNTDYPSWGYMIEKGATTIWELWNGDTADPAMNSRNHVMLLGDLLIWYYENLAGIKNDPTDVGFHKIWMEPVFPEKLGYVKASYNSPYGIISSSWKRDGNKLVWDVAIPANTTATLKLPARFGIKPDAATAAGIHTVSEEGGFVLIELGSGTYHFE
ncbi:MAG: glycoside hydrolase family 78 protein [Tannerella sp.]|jgi:alpha-L-rhamnosidase|nr:glycoside hydrolase family 78 protein [Tannerella sp.]